MNDYVYVFSNYTDDGRWVIEGVFTDLKYLFDLIKSLPKNDKMGIIKTKLNYLMSKTGINQEWLESENEIFKLEGDNEILGIVPCLIENEKIDYLIEKYKL